MWNSEIDELKAYTESNLGLATNPRLLELIDKLIDAYRELQNSSTQWGKAMNELMDEKDDLESKMTEAQRELNIRQGMVDILTNEVTEKRAFVLCMERQLNEARKEIERLRKEVACWSLVWDEDCPNAHQAKKLPSQAPDYP